MSNALGIKICIHLVYSSGLRDQPLHDLSSE